LGKKINVKCRMQNVNCKTITASVETPKRIEFKIQIDQDKKHVKR
jgi:hypothetical protein